MWIKDPKTKQKSVTLTLFVVGFIVALAKLAVSGLSVGSFAVESFSGTDFAAVVGALGATYALRKNTEAKHDPHEGSDRQIN